MNHQKKPVPDLDEIIAEDRYARIDTTGASRGGAAGGRGWVKYLPATSPRRFEGQMTRSNSAVFEYRAFGARNATSAPASTAPFYSSSAAQRYESTKSVTADRSRNGQHP